MSIGDQERARRCLARGVQHGVRVGHQEIAVVMARLLAKSLEACGNIREAVFVLAYVSEILLSEERCQCAVAVAKLHWASMECAHGLATPHTCSRLKSCVKLFRARVRDPRAVENLPLAVGLLASITKPKRRLRKKTRVDDIW